MRYKKTLEYFKLQLSVEQQRLLILNLSRNPHIVIKLAIIYKVALDNFAI